MASGTSRKPANTEHKITGTVRIWVLIMAPIALTFGAAVFFQFVDAQVAMAGLAIIGMIMGVVCRRHMYNLDLSVQYLLDLEADSAAAEPRFDPLTFGTGFYEAMSRLRNVVAKQQQSQEGQLALVETVMNGLPFPLLVVSRDLEVTQANKAAHVLFERPVVGLSMPQLMRSPEILDTLEEAFETGQSAWREFQEHAGVEAIYRVHMAPLSTTEKAANAEPAPGGRREAGWEEAALVMIEDVSELRRSEQMRVDFIANASHEIRTPLTAVRGMIETIRGPAQNDLEAQKKFIGIMGEQVERLHHLVEDLMSLSRIELHEHARPSDPVELDILIPSVTRSLEWEATNQNMTFQVEIPPHLPALLGEEDEVERLISNLVTNAIKYGNAGSEVRIAAYFHARPWQLPGWRGGQSAVAIAVADRSPGIPKDHIPRLTERFYRVDAARSRNMGGTGLGLAIVKHIIQRHRGALTIESEPGQGSVFAAYFPVYDETAEGSVSSRGLASAAIPRVRAG